MNTTFLRCIRKFRCSEKYGMDLNPSAADHAARNVTLIRQDCSARWPLDDNFLDVVFTSNFFEHLPTKGALEVTLREALRCLKRHLARVVFNTLTDMERRKMYRPSTPALTPALT